MTPSTRPAAPSAVGACTRWLGASLLLAAACAPDAPLAARAERDAPSFASLSGAHTAFADPRSIEAAWPGAHPDFNLPTSAEGCPFVAPDDRTFFLASNRDAGKGLDIFVSTRASADAPWGAPVNLGAPVNSSVDDFCPTMARDGHTLYFVSRRQVGVQGVDWCGGGDIYVTRRRDHDRWDAPQNLGCAVNSAFDEFSPFPINEPGAGPVLYFSSTRPGFGSGGNLYRSESHGGTYDAPALVPGVNSLVDDGQPNLRRDALELFFYSARGGNNDIYVSTRASTAEPWSTPVPVAAANSSFSETRPSLSWDGTRLYFGTTREGSNDVWVVARTAAAPAP